MSTLGERLRAEPGRYLDQHLVLSRGFVIDKTNDLAPAAAEDAAVETRFGPSTVEQEFTVFVDLGLWRPGHVGDFQVFNREHLAISVINQGVGNLMGNARRDIA